MSTDPFIHPVILCGGSGTRLWPLSRKSLPKPFLPLVGEKTLFEQAVERSSGAANFADPIVVAGAAHVELIEAQMHGAPHRLIIEPAAKNTAPAIALAAAQIAPDDIMLVCPSDHHIADSSEFREAAKAAAGLAAQDYLVSFGIAAERPETGYGYLKRGEPVESGFAIAQFVEKPDLATAEQYLASGSYSWNGGIFAFRAGQLLSELRAYRPNMADAVVEAVQHGQADGSRFHPAAEIFATIEGDSIDYAVMENTARAAMVPANMGWSDIGNWPALRDALASEADEAGNVTKGSADLIDCSNVHINSDGPRVSAVGLNNVTIIVSDGEVLVTSDQGAQKIGKLPGAKNQ